MKEINRAIAKRTLLTIIGGTLIASTGFIGAALLHGCSSDSGASTGGRRVVLQTRVTLDPTAISAFVTGFGWKVTLTRAVLATGGFYYFDGAPPLVLRSNHRPWEFAERWLGIREAHAHPGHYQAGNAVGQMLEPASVDLFAGPAELAAGDGISGFYRSARFSFSAPPMGALATALGGHIVLTEGRAEKVGEPLRIFRATADLVDVERSAAAGHVEGCEFEETAIESDGVVTVRIKPQVWFDLVDFAQIPAGSDATPSEFPAESQPKIAFAQGLAQLSAYRFTYSKL